MQRTVRRRCVSPLKDANRCQEQGQVINEDVCVCGVYISTMRLVKNFGYVGFAPDDRGAKVAHVETTPSCLPVSV
jgi:hypothetical protein